MKKREPEPFGQLWITADGRKVVTARYASRLDNAFCLIADTTGGREVSRVIPAAERQGQDVIHNFRACYVATGAAIAA